MKTKYIIYSNYGHQSERKIGEFSDKEEATKEFEWFKSCLDCELSLILVIEEKIG